ncbi:hypothetical protein LPZ50_24305, partial [Bordetella petrii]
MAALRNTLQSFPGTTPRLAVATSGGADSAMLAAHAAQLASRAGTELMLFHVHHGLQPPPAISSMPCTMPRRDDKSPMTWPV